MGCSKQRQTNESLALIAYFLGRIHTAAAAVSQTSEPSDSLASRTAVGAQQAIAHTPNCSACTFAWWVLPRAECSSIYIHTSKRSRGTLAKLSSIIACCYECSRLCRQCPRLCLHPTRLQGSARRLGQPTRSTLASASGGRRRLVCRSPLVLTPLRPCHRRLSVVLAACGHRNPPRGRAPTSHHPTQPHAKAPASAPRGRGAVRGRAEAVVAPAVAPPTVTVTAQMVVAQLAVGNATSARRLLQASR